MQTNSIKIGNSSFTLINYKLNSKKIKTDIQLIESLSVSPYRLSGLNKFRCIKCETETSIGSELLEKLEKDLIELSFSKVMTEKSKISSYEDGTIISGTFFRFEKGEYERVFIFSHVESKFNTIFVVGEKQSIETLWTKM